MTKKKKYLEFQENQSKGYPSGKTIFYECTICGDVIESQPEYFAECSCQNLTVDMTASRFTVDDHSKFKIFKQ